MLQGTIRNLTFYTIFKVIKIQSCQSKNLLADSYSCLAKYMHVNKPL